ncbi:hypothetical protein Hanom_Chr11g00997781 [Helianthus anomalus]
MQERKRLSERVKPELLTSGWNQPLFPLSELLLKKVYVESLRSMSASVGDDEDFFTAQSTQGRLSLILSQEVEVLLVSSMLIDSECGLNNFLDFVPVMNTSFSSQVLFLLIFGESFLPFHIC